MKKFNFLSKLWSSVAGSQRNDVEFDRRLTVGSPSGFTMNWTLKLVSVLVIVLSLGIGNVWGADYSKNESWDFGTSGNANWSGHSSGYCGGCGSKNNAFNVYKTNISNFSAVNFSNHENVSLTIYVKAGTNSGTNSYTVKLIDSSGNQVSTYSITKLEGMGTGSNTSSAKESSVTFTPTVAFAGYKVEFQSKGFITQTRYVLTYDDKGAAPTPTHTLGYEVSPAASGTVVLSATTVAEGSTATATATPNSGYRFSSWAISGTGASLSSTSTNPTTVTMGTANATVTANFVSKGCTDHGASSITSGVSSGDDYGPIHAYYEYSTSQILYTKSDLDLAAGKKGTIKSIYFEYSGAAAMSARTIKIYMANTALSSLTTSNYVPYASFTQVYSGTFSCGSAGWYEITLDTPFDYDGIGNLVVMVDDNTNSYQDDKNFKYHSATGKQIYKRQDDTDIDPASWTPASAIDYRPNTKFCIQEADMTPVTVTLMDNSKTITEASAGAGVTLPSRAGCAGYTFAGWTKTWVAPQSSWTTTAPTIIPAGSYTPTANENLYPVYTKEEGEGEPVETKTQEFQYDTWTKGGSSTDKSTYRLFHNGGYVESATNVDFSKLSKVIVYGGTFGGTSYDDISIRKADGTIWKDATVSGSSQTGTNTITGGTSLTGSAKLRVYSTIGTATGSGVRISKVEVYTMEGGTTTYYISEANCCSLQAATSVTVTDVAATSVTLGWTAPSPTTGITKLQVVDGNGTVKVDNLAANATSATVTELTECESYSFHIVSVGASCNVSSASVPAQPYSGAKTVTYNYHDGTGSPASFTTDCSHTSTTLPTPTRSGYRFDGWYDAATSGSLVGAGGASYTPSANITLHAYWTRVYTVTYNYNGGSGSCVAGGPYAEDETVTTCATATKEGSTLSKWVRSDNSAEINPGGTFAMPSSNVTLTAKWIDTEYDLTQTVGANTTKGYTAEKIKSGDTPLDLTYTVSAANKALPKTVTISGGRASWTLGTDYTWTVDDEKHSATLHINATIISSAVTITVAEQARYTVVWDEHGSTTTDYYAADDNTVVEKTGIADCGTKKFALWTENSSFDAHATTPPAKATFGTISGDKHYYAIYGTATGTGGYSKVTTVAEGEVYLLACPSQGKVYVGQHLTDAYGDDADVSITDNKISSKGTAHEVRIEGNASKFAIYDIDAEKYIFGPTTNDASCTWSIGPTAANTTNHWWNIGSGDYAGEIQGQNQTARYFSYNYNGSNHRFAAYKTPGSNNTGKVYFYKYAPGFVDYAKTCEQYDINIAATSDGTVTTTPADEAGAGQTVTVNVTPNSCKYLSALKYNDGSDHAISIASTPYTFTMPASAVTITATFADKSVSSIAANTSTHRTLMQSTSFVGEQIRVTYNNGETEDLAWNDASLTFSGYNMSTLSNQTVSVAYSGSCGSANTSYPIEVTDGIPVTYNDGNVTYVRKYEVGDIVGVDTITGKIGCSGYTFVGWSETEISSTDDEYVPVHNFTATTKTLYAVYSLQKKTGWMSIESADEMKSGAEYMYVKVRYSDAFALANTASAANSNYMAASIVTSGMGTWRRTSDNKDFQIFTGDAPATSIWQVIKQSTNYYLYNADAAKYLKITSSAIQLTATPDDNFSFVDGDNDCEVMIKSSNSNYYASGYYSNPNYYFNPYSSKATGHYLLTRDSLFTTNPPCSPRSVTFHGNGGTVTASGGGSSGGTLVVTEATRDAGINLPTASIDAEDCEGNEWNFFGWIDHPVDVTRVPILTTDMLNDGYDAMNPNPHYNIVTDNDEFWAVYANTGAPETKYGTISFSMSDIRLDYHTDETEVTKTVAKMGDYTFGYKRVGHQSQEGIQLESETGEFYNKTSLGKINSISFNTFKVGGINNLKVYVGDAAKATTYELTAAERQTDGSVVTYYPAHNCEYVYIKNYNSYVCVEGISIDFGRGTTVYATTPVCSTISLSGDVYVTSRSGIGIMAVTPLSVEAHQLAANADVVITSNSSDVYFSTDRTPNFSKASKPTASVTVRANASGELDATPIYVHYKPSSTGTGAASDVTVYANLSPTNPNIKGEHTIHVRNLPEKVVIAAKVGGAYYALPADMDAATNPAGVLIDVNEEDMTATAPENCTYTIWPVKTTSGSEDRYALHEGNAYGERVRFSAPNNTTTANAGLWANNSSGVATIRNYAAIAAISADPAAAYEWKITTTVTDGKWSHTLQTDQSTNKNYLRYWTAASGGPKWGTYVNGEQNIYLLPVTEVAQTEAYFVEWGQHGGVIEVDAQGVSATKVKAKLNGEESALQTLSQTLTSVKNRASVYNYTVNFGNDIDFSVAASAGATLALKWYNNSDVLVATSNIIVPRIIAESATMSSIESRKTYWTTENGPTNEVHVLPGVTLTANAGSFTGENVTIKQLEIYQGATVKVTSGTLDVDTLVLRNGWSRAGEKRYDVARLHIATTANLTTEANHVYADWYIDYDQYYPVAVPWDVTLANIRYRYCSVSPTIGYDQNIRLRYYDGDERAEGSGTESNWKDFGKSGNIAMPTKIVPAHGYAITAKRPSGKAFSILRMPLTIPSNSWTALGEQGVVSNTHKDTVHVIAHGYEKTPWYAMGWNFVANPYMCTFNSAGDEGITGNLSMQNGGSVRYATIPDVDFKNFEQVNIATADLKPSSGFLVQVGTTGALTFNKEKIVAPTAPARYMAEQESIAEQEVYVLLSNDGGRDQMGLIIGSDYTEAYEVNADLSKMLGESNTIKTWMRYTDMDMAYVAINEDLAREWIPVTVNIPTEGEYTYSMLNSSIVDELEGVYLIDYKTGKTTNLIYDDYTFSSEAGTDSDRFAINAIVGKHNVPTGADLTESERNSNSPVKFIWQDKVYILHNNVIYDSTGKRVNVINK